MELNKEQANILEMIREYTDLKGYVPSTVYNPEGRSICAHLMQRGFIGFNFDRQGYYITDRGRKELQSEPTDKAAALRADIARLETALADKRAQLAALGEESEG